MMRSFRRYPCRICGKNFEDPQTDGVCNNCWVRQTESIPDQPETPKKEKILDRLLKVPIGVFGWIVRLFRIR